MRSPKLATAGIVTAALLSLGTAFALPAFALSPADPNCPEGAQKTCRQAPPATCPQGTLPTEVQPPAGEGTTCTLDSLIRARAKADVLTQDQLIKLCADVRVRQLANIRIAVGHPRWEIITLDGKTCGEPTGFKNCAEAAAAGYHDIPSTDPHYASWLDRDHDGIACESPAPSTVVPVVPPGDFVPAPVAGPLPEAPAPVTIPGNLPVTH